jgi:hypothetical protein
MKTKSGFWIDCRGRSYWGIGLWRWDHPCVEISKMLHEMSAKLKRRWAKSYWRYNARHRN